MRTKVILLALVALLACSAGVPTQEPVTPPVVPITRVNPSAPNSDLSYAEGVVLRVVEAFNSMGHDIDCTVAEDPDTTVASNLVRDHDPLCQISVEPEVFEGFELTGRDSTAEGVIGHEVGHTMLAMNCGDCTRGHVAELFCDRLGGCLLAVLGRGEEEAIAASFYFGSLKGGTTHPHAADREFAFIEGYRECAATIMK